MGPGVSASTLGATFLNEPHSEIPGGGAATRVPVSGGGSEQTLAVVKGSPA